MPNPHPNTSGLLRGNPGPRRPQPSLAAFKEFCRDIAFEDPIVQERLRKEMRNGTIHPGLHTVLLHYGFGVPPKKLEIDSGDRGRPTLRTQRPIGWDPLNPENPNVTVIEAIYGHVPALPAHPGDAADVIPAEQEPETPDVRTKPGEAPSGRGPMEPDRSSIVPKARRARPKKGPDDGATPLRVDGV